MKSNILSASMKMHGVNEKETKEHLGWYLMIWAMFKE